MFRAILTEIQVFEVARSFRNWRKKTKIATSTKLKAVVTLRGIVLTSVILSLTLGLLFPCKFTFKIIITLKDCFLGIKQSNNSRYK